MELSGIYWVFIGIGVICLFAAIVYGNYRSGKASKRQEMAGERGARDLYHKDQSKS